MQVLDLYLYGLPFHFLHACCDIEINHACGKLLTGINT